MNSYWGRLQKHLLPSTLFPGKPQLSFACEQTRCPRCHQGSRVLKTITREVATFSIGHFIAHETQRYCPGCPERPVFVSGELHRLVPPGARYAFDVIDTVGQALFVRCRNSKEIRHELGEKNIDISLREIDHLAGDSSCIWHWPMNRARSNSQRSCIHGAVISCIWMEPVKATAPIS